MTDCEECAKLRRRNAEILARLEGAALAMEQLEADAARWRYFTAAPASERVWLAEMPGAVERAAIVDARRKA